MKQIHNPAEGDALERLFELAVLLTEAMDQGLTAQGLSRARAQVVWRLRGLGSATQRELSQALRCTPRNVTGLVDALQAAGLVARSPHPTDRRATLVTLTTRGAATAARWEAEYRRLAGLLFGGLAATELGGFVATLDRVADALRQAAVAREIS
jgi:DNA-binding MarR family transcriptional regulator